MPVTGLGGVGAQKPVPPRQVEAVVAVGFCLDDGMMHPVHVRGDDEQAQHPIDAFGDPDVRVIEHGRRVQKNLENQYRDGGRPKGGDDGQLDPHRQEDFDRVEPKACGYVKAEVGMVHPVQPPKRRHGMKQHMLEIDREIQHHDRDENDDPSWCVQHVKQTPAILLRKKRETDGGDRVGQADEDGIDHHHAQVVGPADEPGDFNPAAGSADFP